MKLSIPLSFRIIGLSVILVSASLVVMNLMITRQVETGVQESQIKNLQQAVDLASRYIGDLVASQGQTTSDIAEEIDLLQETNQSTSKIPAILDHKLATEPFLEQILLCSADGKILYTTKGPFTGGSLLKLNLDTLLDSHRSNDSKQSVVSDAFRPLDTGPIVFCMVQALQPETNNTERFIVTIVDLDDIFAKTVSKQVYGKEGYPFLGDQLGRVLSHPAKATAFTDQRNQEFMEKVSKVLRDGRLTGTIDYPWQGRQKQLSFAMIPGTSMFVAATVWDDDLFSLARDIAATLLLLGGSTLLVIILALTLAILFFVSRPLGKLTGNLSHNADNLESASQQISASSEQLSSGSSELAASVEEISASLEELESVVELNTKNINESELLMRDTNEGSQKVSVQMGILSSALREIGASSDEIVSIIMVIEDIAFQTNILALNAAVEAGRAGEAGRGFSVVADQVKDLAQKSATAAKETSKLIQKALKNIAHGESLGSEVMEIQKKAAHMASQVSTLLDEVNRASQEQMKGIKQITIAVNQTNAVVQQTASSAEETASASEELYSQAEELNSAVGLLSRLVKGHDDRSIKSNATKTPHHSHQYQSGQDKKPDLEGKLSIQDKRKIPGTQKSAGFDPDAIMPMDPDFDKL